jgi:transposase
MPLSERKFRCLNCGFICHRDLNAAINIDTVGMDSAKLNACGLDVRPSSLKANEIEAGTINKPA